MKQLLLIIGLSMFFIYCENKTVAYKHTAFEDEVLPIVKEKRDKTEEIRKPDFRIKEKLGKPFGTFIKLKVEMYDGDSLYTKSDEGKYLLKVISVDDKKLTEPKIMEFQDKTGKFPADDLELNGYLRKIKNGEISKSELNENIETYVGSEYEVVGYETGEFSGLPYGGDYEFTQIPCGKEFHFRNYLILIADLKNLNL